MMTTLALYFLRKGVPQWLAKPLAWLAAILGVIALLGLLWGLARVIIHRHDKQVVSAYENGVQAEINRAVSTAGARADVQENITAAHDATRANEVQEVIRNESNAHPEDARRPVGRVSQHALDRLRH